MIALALGSTAAAGASAAQPSTATLAAAGSGAGEAISRTEAEALLEAVRAQNKKLEEQAAVLEAQRKELDRQREEIERLSRHLTTQDRLRVGQAVTVPAGSGSATVGPALTPLRVDRLDSDRAAGTSSPQRAQSDAPPERVGEQQRREQEDAPRPPSIEVLAEVGGVLTPEGTFVLDPQFEYSHSSVNRFFFQGVEIVDAVLIGIIEATDSDRDTLTPSIGARYGITDRLEVDARIPYVRRDDRVTNTEVSTGTNNIQDLTGDGLGDIEFGAHYQINRGRGGWPYFVGNVRVKTDTGTGPFDVDRDAAGIETELATGSGFWAVEPSVTVIYPTDPAVLFANVGYLWNISRDIDKQIGGSLIGNVDPGDSFNASFGIGFALNQDVSINLGYQHNFVQGTVTELNGVETESNTLQVGSFLFGISYSVAENVGVNVSLAAGLTEDAPDAQITVRVPITFDFNN